MDKDLVLKRYLAETAPAFIIMIAIAIVSMFVCALTGVHWTTIALIGVFASIVSGMFAHFVRRIRNGTFGNDPRERQALERWLSRHGGVRIPGNLPG